MKNILLRILYYLLKGLVKLALRVFYRRTVVLDGERLRMDKGPYILVSNHPNTLLDPLIPSARVNRMVYFLANAGLFQTPFQHWFFSTFYCIRVERPTDVQGRPLDNKASFALSSRHLGRNGVLYIAPEAYSFKGRKLMPLKTGTMRIALSAEQQHDFQLGLRILPVGLNYESPYDFRSDILIRVGEPMTFGDQAEAYAADPYETVRRLTTQLEERLAELVLTTQDAEEDQLLRRLETLLQHDRPQKLAEQHFRARRLLAGLQQYRAGRPEGWPALVNQSNDYFQQLDEAQLSDRDIARPGSCRLLRRSVLALLSLPFFAYGWINNYLAAFTPEWIRRKINTDEEYDATVRSVAGVVTVPLFYGLQYALVRLFLPAPYPLVYLLSLLPLGLWAWELKRFYQALIFTWRFQRTRRENPDLVRELTRKRAALVARIGELLD